MDLRHGDSVTLTSIFSRRILNLCIPSPFLLYDVRPVSWTLSSSMVEDSTFLKSQSVRIPDELKLNSPSTLLMANANNMSILELSPTMKLGG